MNPADSRLPLPPRSLRGWSYTLGGLLVLSGVIGAVIFVFTRDTNTAAAYGARVLLAHALTDSWNPMIVAIEHLRRHPDVPVYSAVFFAGRTKFQYPTSSLLFIDLLQRVTGASWPAIIAALNWMSWCCIWMTGLASWRLFLRSYEDADRPPSEPASDRILLLGAGLALTVAFYPLAQSYVLGQIQTSITLLTALALLAWQRGRKETAALCIGICCAVKPQWAMLLLWGALRREWTLAAVGAATFAGLALAAGVLYGFNHWIDYLSVLSFISQRGEGYYPNQSVNGLMNRLLFNGTNVTWLETWPDFHPVVYAATVGAAVLILGAALTYRIREQAGVRDLALIILSMTMASPIAWEHHYGVLLPIFALLAPIALSERPFGQYSGAYLVIAFVVASQRLDLTNRLANTRFNVLQSYLFFAAAMVLVLLYRSSQPKRVDAARTRGSMASGAGHV